MEEKEYGVYEIHYTLEHAPEDWKMEHCVAPSAKNAVDLYVLTNKRIVSITQLGMIYESNMVL